MPLCARCSGMYLGAMLGLVFQSIVGTRRGGNPPRGVMVILGTFVVAFAVDGLNSYLSLFPGAPTLYEPQNWLRLFTGTGMGLVIAAALYPAFHYTMWRQRDSRPAIPGIRSVMILITLASLLDLTVLSENSWILYPLALVSAAGVLVILTMVYGMIGSFVFRAENRIDSLPQIFLPLLGGFGVATLQIALLDFGRYFLTGTWEGFHLG